MRTRDESKEQTIREKAIEMIVQEGFDGLSMQKLAKAANVSPATIYIYWKDRDDLILQLYVEVNTKMMKAFLQDFDPEMPFAKGMEVQWKNRAKYFLEFPMETRFSEQIKHSPFYAKALSMQSTEFKQVMGTFIKNAWDRKELSCVPFEAFWSVAYAPLYQLMKYHSQGKNHLNEDFELNDQIMAQTLALVIKALTP